MAKLKVFSVGSNSDSTWFLTDYQEFELTNNLSEADIVTFPGGSDWNPVFYNEVARNGTFCHDMHDRYQLKKALSCIESKKFMVGICRGAQMLSILAGGKLIQHVNNHVGSIHEINTYDGRKLFTNSIHHQMMDPYNLPYDHYKVLATTKSLSDTYLNGDNKEVTFENTEIEYKDVLTTEPEIIYFNKIGGFGIQGHPEMGSMPFNTVTFILDEIKEAYEQFQIEKLNGLPSIVSSRVKHIHDIIYKDSQSLFTSTNNLPQIQKHDAVKVEENRYSKFPVYRDWSY